MFKDTDPETVELSTLDIGAIIELDGEQVELVDYKRVVKYGPAVWAYADPETGEHLGLLADGSASHAVPVHVNHYGYADT